MAYKEPKFDKNGIKALRGALEVDLGKKESKSKAAKSKATKSKK